MNHIPLRRILHRKIGRNFPPPAPWWNDICQQAVTSRREFLSTFRRCPSFSNYLAFKKQEATTRRILRVEKRRGWREFCGGLGPNTPISTCGGLLGDSDLANLRYPLFLPHLTSSPLLPSRILSIPSVPHLFLIKFSLPSMSFQQITLANYLMILSIFRNWFQLFVI